jgi:hypothetical protein
LLLHSIARECAKMGRGEETLKFKPSHWDTKPTFVSISSICPAGKLSTLVKGLSISRKFFSSFFPKKKKENQFQFQFLIFVFLSFSHFFSFGK